MRVYVCFNICGSHKAIGPEGIVYYALDTTSLIWQQWMIRDKYLPEPYLSISPQIFTLCLVLRRVLVSTDRCISLYDPVIHVPDQLDPDQQKETTLYPLLVTEQS